MKSGDVIQISKEGYAPHDVEVVMPLPSGRVVIVNNAGTVYAVLPEKIVQPKAKPGVRYHLLDAFGGATVRHRGFGRPNGTVFDLVQRWEMPFDPKVWEEGE